MTLSMWTRKDEINLRNRVRRLIDRPEPVPSERCAPPTGKADWCIECKAGNHGHKAARVGPYLICRCLNCLTLVIEEGNGA
jgi:hypothetical protein